MLLSCFCAASTSLPFDCEGEETADDNDDDDAVVVSGVESEEKPSVADTISSLPTEEAGSVCRALAMGREKAADEAAAEGSTVTAKGEGEGRL